MWNKIEDIKPEGGCLVYLEEEMFGTRIHVAYYYEDITLIGGRFGFDCPKVTHWMMLPSCPE